jgi:uncharacterized RDD family membrane protein YckC
MLEQKIPSLEIRTPEGLTFSLLLATPMARMWAWIVDFLIISTVSGLIRNMAISTGSFSMAAAEAFYYLMLFVLSVIYGIFFEWWMKGQTFGKRLFRLQVMDASGFKLDFYQIIMRNLLRFIDMIPGLYAVGGAFAMTNAKLQRLGDLAASTVVVRKPPFKEPDVTRIMAGTYNSLRDYPHLVRRLRQKTSPKEAMLALHALLRRDTLDAEARLELYQTLAAYYRELVPFPEEVSENLSDEAYLRAVVDVIFTDPTKR